MQLHVMVSRFFLARVSPLLADTVKVGEGGQVHASVSPEGMRLPSEAYTIRMDPLRLTLGRGMLLDRLVNILQAGQVSILILSTPPVFSAWLWRLAATGFCCLASHSLFNFFLLCPCTGRKSSSNVLKGVLVQSHS